MKFSVVIPLYNKEKHIKRSIESVLNQTYEDFELIIIDDGSTDLSKEKAKEIIDHRIKIISKKNEGVSAARNYGIENSNFEYIAFLDGDDTWEPLFLESIADLINDYPEAGAYASSYNFVGNNGKKNANINITLQDNEKGTVKYFKSALKNPLISASSVVIPKRVFTQLGYFSTNLIKGEDLEMWARIGLHYNVAFINKVLASYYLNSENRSDTKKVDYSNTFMSQVEDMLEKHKSAGNTDIYFEEYIIGRLMSRVRKLILTNNRKEAKRILNKYKHTKYYKKEWYKNYFLSYYLVYLMYKLVKK
ncbi:glycosyl transferase [Oceanobacillus oncorhynchi subsp. incaldanensis]|uniref:glycosyltransferase family 2 protein n=1 Tax=Oceanobacillus oncorhynchi TaxID=545501 RepID=UPI001B088A60|nr:glycosyltransferase family 2 protein [Oceanobacillus oncorhynchi]GIO19647.1 glycosyl transferase [Oceanobacillus oncorhynchi subsp. incaldanensis]